MILAVEAVKMNDDCVESQFSSVLQSNRVIRCPAKFSACEHNICVFRERQP